MRQGWMALLQSTLLLASMGFVWLGKVGPVAAQSVRSGSIPDYSYILRHDESAAEDAHVKGWPDLLHYQPGTQVTISFDAHNADITIATNHSFGLERLLQAARNIALSSGYPRADYITWPGEKTVGVDIELNKYMRLGHLRSAMSFGLGDVAAALQHSRLSHPIAIIVDSGRSTDSSVSSKGIKSAISNYWFTSPEGVSPRTRLIMRVALTPLVILEAAASGLLLGLPFLAVVWSLLNMKRTRAGKPKVLNPDAVQSAYDKRPPLWVIMSAIPLAAIVLATVVLPRAISSLTIATSFIPLGDTAVTVIPIVVAALIFTFAVVTTRLPRDNKTSEPDPDTVRLKRSQKSFFPLMLVFAMLMAIPMVLISLPVYTQSALVWRKYVGYALIGFAPFFGVIMMLQMRRLMYGARTAMTSGPWYDMVMDLARQSGVGVKRVMLIDSSMANAYATAFGSVGLTAKLLEKLEPDEVRAVVAHEIGHLSAHHPRQLLIRSLVALVVAVVIWQGSIWLFRSHLSRYQLALLSGPLPYFLVLYPGMALALGPGRRKREEEADRFALNWVEDPEVLVRALTKIHVLLATPARLKPSDEAFSSHPSLAHRVEAIRASVSHSAH